MPTVVYAGPELKQQMRDAAARYEKILQESGDLLPRNQAEGLRHIILTLKEKIATPKLKGVEWKKFRLLRESATTLCALPQSGEPLRYGAGILSAGRVGGHFGAQ